MEVGAAGEIFNSVELGKWQIYKIFSDQDNLNLNNCNNIMHVSLVTKAK